MRTLNIYVEINGNQQYIGDIKGNSPEDACFRYADSYLDSAGCKPVSVSLPLQTEQFSSARTKNYFEGLLPEGFTRKSVAQWMHVQENDYLSILSGLGNECLGALRITEEDASEIPASYELLTTERVKELAREGATKSAELVTESHLSLTGASGKVGLYYEEERGSWYLPKGDAPSTHIVKQSHVRLEGIVANEQLSLLTARHLGIDVPGSFIINTGNAEDRDVLFATERFDRTFANATRTIDGHPTPFRLHQEDFAQALGIAAADKYEKPGDSHMRRMFDLIRQVSSNPIEDQLKLWNIVVFDYLTGDTDNHIKNFSLLYSPDLKSIRLAPAYDIVSTTVYEASTRNMAFSIGEKFDIRTIGREDFANASRDCGINRKTALRHFDRMADRFEECLTESARMLADSGFVNVEAIKEAILKNGGYGNI